MKLLPKMLIGISSLCLLLPLLIIGLALYFGSKSQQKIFEGYSAPKTFRETRISSSNGKVNNFEYYNNFSRILYIEVSNLDTYKSIYHINLMSYDIQTEKNTVLYSFDSTFEDYPAKSFPQIAIYEDSTAYLSINNNYFLIDLNTDKVTVVNYYAKFFAPPLRASMERIKNTNITYKQETERAATEQQAYCQDFLNKTSEAIIYNSTGIYKIGAALYAPYEYCDMIEDGKPKTGYMLNAGIISIKPTPENKDYLLDKKENEWIEYFNSDHSAFIIAKLNCHFLDCLNDKNYDYMIRYKDRSKIYYDYTTRSYLKYIVGSDGNVYILNNSKLIKLD